MRTRLMIILFVVAVVAAAAADAAAAARRTITVEGTGIVTSVPDQAQFTFGVSTTGTTARAALTGNSTRMNRLIAAIERQGVPQREIQTAQISLTPNTNENGTKILDFTASNSVTVTTRSIATSGAIVDAAVAAGANQVGGPSLSPSDQLALERRALGAAITDARARALAIAVASHVRLGAVQTVQEGTPTPITFAPTAKAANGLSTTPVQPGTVQTEEDVTVTYAIA
jgi:uncharacterized protein YggE